MTSRISCSVALVMGLMASSHSLANHDYDAEFAYQQIKALQAENSGILDFDMRFALVAISVKRFDEAIFALERVLQAEPNHARARTELARCYFETGQYHLARTLFKQVTDNPSTPAIVQHNINYYLHEMDQRGSQFELQNKFYVEGSVGRDDNINAGSDLSSIDIPNLGNVTLDANSLAQDSSTQGLAAGASLYKATSKFKAWSLQANYQQIDTTDNDHYDTNLVALNGAHHWINHHDKYQFGLQYQALSLGGEDFFDSLGMAAQWHRSLSERLVTGMTLQWHSVDFSSDNNFRDHDRLLFSADIMFNHGHWRHQLGSFIGTEKPADSQFDYALRDAMWGYNYRLSYLFRANLIPYLSAQYSAGDYGASHPIFAQQRRDSTQKLEAGLIWQAGNGLTVSPSISDTRHSSNIEAYSYDRDRAQIKLRYNF